MTSLSRACNLPIVSPDTIHLPSEFSYQIEGLPVYLLCKSDFGSVTLVHSLPFLEKVINLDVFARAYGALRVSQVLALPDAIEAYHARLGATGRLSPISYQDFIEKHQSCHQAVEQLCDLGLLPFACAAQEVSSSDLMVELEKISSAPDGAEAAYAALVKGVPFLKITENIPETSLKIIPLSVQRKFDVVVVAHVGSAITVAAHKYLPLQTRSELESYTSAGINRFSYVVTEKRLIRDSINFAQTNSVSPETLAKGIKFENQSTEVDAERININALAGVGGGSEEPTIKIVQHILAHGISNKASDIHISGQPDYMWVRFRIDGVISDYPNQLSRDHTSETIARIKFLANLHTQKVDVPQDGKITVELEESRYELRVNTSYTAESEKAVLRIQDKDREIPTFDELGIGARERAIINDVINGPHGLLIITGPTGSGKTTTLYAAIGQIDRRAWNVITLEDPVELQIPFTEQHPIKGDFTWDVGIAAALRQDPDYLMVAEVRDESTASSVIRAAITGHVVMTTLHTNSAAGAPSRLIELGAAPYLLANSLSAVCAQRLLRRVCSSCSTSIPIPSSIDLRRMKINPDWIPPGSVFLESQGCSLCRGTGYRGRIGIMEAYANSPEIKDIIKSHNGSPDQIRAAMVLSGGKTLFQQAIDKAVAGITTLSEALTIYSNDD